jgi:hypothetical protein
VDQNNNPLHKIPVHLTAKGCFQFEYDSQRCEFRSLMAKAYNQKVTRMKDVWYSMCVFVPTFQSMMRGEGAKQRSACIPTRYGTPDEDNWLSLCVGRRDDLVDDDLTYTQYVYQLYCKTRESCKAKGWWKREE